MGGYISKYAYGATYTSDNVSESTVVADAYTNSAEASAEPSKEVSTKIVEASTEPSKEVTEPSKEVSTEVVEPAKETTTSVSSDSNDATGIFESISRNKKKKGKKPKKD